MVDDKDMIEINLNTPITTNRGKGFNYFGNISISKASDGGFPYGQYQNDDESFAKRNNSKIGGLQFVAPNEYPQHISCLRQMYCPDCEQRLDEDSVLVGRSDLCCFPVFSLNRFYKCYIKSHGDRRIYCKNCGGDMGYWKQH